MARPRKDEHNSRRKAYPLRLNAEERAALDAAAAAHKTTPADFLRASFMQPDGLHGSASFRAEFQAVALDPAIIAALSRIGANLNQVARRVNSGDNLQPGEMPEVLDGIGRILERIEAVILPAME